LAGILTGLLFSLAWLFIYRTIRSQNVAGSSSTLKNFSWMPLKR